ncbi:MAG: sporulation protein YqfD [Clostridia bacterium]|nr:sporulation protein YqfD [Clostridia bacterium]
MLLDRIIRYIKGMLRITLRGAYCEQVLSILQRKNVTFYHLRRIDEQTVSVMVMEKDFSVIQAVCSRYYMELEVKHTSSFRTIRQRYKKRWGLVVGAGASLVLLIGINCFVWDVQVSGCEIRTSQAEIVRQFEELGFGIGTFRFGWDLTDLENKFMMQNKEVIWVSVNMKFTTAHIELQERSTKIEKIYDFKTPCDIYAARDGQIVSMMVSSGTPLVSEGDAVRAGEKLVSREYVTKYGETLIVPSIATIKAKTGRTICLEEPLTKQLHTPTGKSRTFFEINLFNFKIPLYFKENISYNNYDYTEKRTVLKLGNNWALPISVFSKKYTDVYVTEEKISEDIARRTTYGKLQQSEKAQLFDAEILDKKIEESIVDGKFVLTATYSCLENIAQTIRK